MNAEVAIVIVERDLQPHPCSNYSIANKRHTLEHSIAGGQCWSETHCLSLSMFHPGVLLVPSSSFEMVHLCVALEPNRFSAQLIAPVLRLIDKQYAPSPPKEACHQDPAPAAADHVCVAQTMCLAVRAPPPDPGPQQDEVLILPFQAHYPAICIWELVLTIQTNMFTRTCL